MSGYPWVCILAVRPFKVGDPPPSGYMEWHEWARVQHKGGLRQARCPACGKLEFPQERCRVKP